MDETQILTAALAIGADEAQETWDRWTAKSAEDAAKYLDGLALVIEEKGWSRIEARCKTVASAHKLGRKFAVPGSKRQLYSRSALAVLAKEDFNRGEAVPLTV